MKLHSFVSGSAVLITGWLTLTFLHDVSPQQYPQQRKSLPAHAANRGPIKLETLSPPAIAETATRLTVTPKH